MKKVMSRMIVLVFVLLSTTACAGGNKSGKVSGSWETNGHWQSAGDQGVVCEYRHGKKKAFKVKVYTCDDMLCQEYEDLRFWPDSCNVSTADLQARWGHLGTIVEDTGFVAEVSNDKETLRRWLIR